MRDRSGRRNIDPPAARELAPPERASRDTMKQRLGRLPPEHPSSPRYREALASSGSSDDEGASGSPDRRALPGRRRWTFPSRGRGAQPGGRDGRSGGGDGRSGGGDGRAGGGDGRAGGGDGTGEYRRGPRGDGRGVPGDTNGDARRGGRSRRTDQQAGRDAGTRAERMAAQRGSDGSALPSRRRGGTEDRQRGDGTQPGTSAAVRRDRRNPGVPGRRGDQHGRGDQSAAGRVPRPRNPPYRPWFTSGGEGPPWFADGTGAGDAGKR